MLMMWGMWRHSIQVLLHWWLVWNRPRALWVTEASWVKSWLIRRHGVLLGSKFVTMWWAGCTSRRRLLQVWRQRSSNNYLISCNLLSFNHGLLWIQHELLLIWCQRSDVSLLIHFWQLLSVLTALIHILDSWLEVSSALWHDIIVVRLHHGRGGVTLGAIISGIAH